MRQALRQQLEHVNRDIKWVTQYLNEGGELSDQPLGLFDVIKKLYGQQKEMYDERAYCFVVSTSC